MKQGGRIFIRFFASYIIIMLIPISMLVHSYNKEIQITRNEMYQRDMALLEQGQRTMNTIINSMNDMIQTLSGSSAVKKLMIYGNVYDNPSLLTNFIDIRDSLASFNLFSYVDSFIMYAFRSDTLINGSQLIYNASSNSNLQFILPESPYKGLSLNKAKELLIKAHYKYEFLPEMTLSPLGQSQVFDKYILYAATISNSAERNAVNVILLLRSDVLLRRLGFTSQSDWLCASMQYNGKTLLQNGQPYSCSYDMNNRGGYVKGEIDGQSVLISYINDERTGLRFSCARSTELIESMIMEKVRNIILSMVFVCILGSILSGIMALHNTAPIRKTLKSMNSRMRNSDSPYIGYADLDKELSNIVNENLTLKHEINVQAPLLRSAMAARWLYGEYANVDEILDAYAKLGNELSFRIYAVIIAVMPVRHENLKNDWDRALVKALLRESMPELIDIVDTESDAFAIIAGTEMRDKNSLKSTITARIDVINNTMPQQIGSELNWFVGIANDAGRIHAVFTELRRLRKSDGEHINRIVWLDSEHTYPTELFFPVELEMRIIDSVKNGDERELSSAFSMLYSENIIRRELAEDDNTRLFAMLKTLFMRLDSESEISYSSDFSAEGMLGEAQKHLITLCHRNCAEHMNRQQKLSAEIEQYICDHYSDSQLSLTAISDYLGYTQSYLSRVFKQQTGEVFSSYVEKQRMKHALELLTANELPIYQIAEKCGYNSVQVFRRAFSKTYGKSPSLYIEQLKNSSEFNRDSHSQYPSQ